MTHDLMPVTRIPRAGLPAHAVVVGDPARAAVVAALLDGAEEISYHREYRVFGGSWKGVPVVVASHGVGAPGAILLFQELADAGVRTFLRFGTAGAMKPGIGDGDLVIAEAAVRDDGVTQQLLPPEYPAVSAPEAVLALQRAAREAAPRTTGASCGPGRPSSRACSRCSPTPAPVSPPSRWNCPRCWSRPRCGAWSRVVWW